MTIWRDSMLAGLRAQQDLWGAPIRLVYRTEGALNLSTLTRPATEEAVALTAVRETEALGRAAGTDAEPMAWDVAYTIVLEDLGARPVPGEADVVEVLDAPGGAVVERLRVVGVEQRAGALAASLRLARLA